MQRGMENLLKVFVAFMEKKDDLIRAALEAGKNACAPYSNFRVGAAVLVQTGEIVKGCNIESASFGLTCCAERVALFNALSQGFRQFIAIAVAADFKDGPMPCGACRQLLIEYAPAAVLYTCDSRTPEKIRAFMVQELLPEAFLAFA